MLVEDGNDIKAYEIKAGRTANTSYFKNLIYWNKLNQNNTQSTVIYGGDLSQDISGCRLISWKEMVSEF